MDNLEWPFNLMIYKGYDEIRRQIVRQMVYTLRYVFHHKLKEHALKYALFITEQSQSATGSKPGQWSTFLATTKALEERCGPTSITEIGQGVFLLNLASGAHALSLLVKHAEDHGFRSRVLFFDQEPSFVITDPPKT